MLTLLFRCAACLVLSASAMLCASEPTLPEGWYVVSYPELGATAHGSGQKFNKDWPAQGTLVKGSGRGGTLFGAPLIDGRVDIRLIVPCDIVAVEVTPLDYRGTRQPKGIDIFIDNTLAKQIDLEHGPGKPVRIPIAGQGQTISIVVTSEHPLEQLANGKTGAPWGGWSRLRVLSTTNLPHMLRPVDGFAVARHDVNIAPTAGSQIAGEVEVVGQPRMSKGHPRTLWDQEDVAHYKAMLKTSPELAQQFAGLKAAMDLRITQPVNVPPAEQDQNGKWLHLSDQAEFGTSKRSAVHNQLALDVANLGTVYQLSGEEKYAEFAKRILLEYAVHYPNYAMGARPGFNHSPSKAFDQILGDAIWIIPMARGYDLIYTLPSITPEERERIEKGFLHEVATLIASNRGMYQASTNWAAIGTTAILIIGVATDTQAFVDIALWGKGGTEEKPNGGLFSAHFGPKAISADGLWTEGAMGYQFMALQALITNAEILWHHGIDLYRYRDGALKSLFDSPLQISYPNLRTPAIHDSGYGSIVSGDAYLYEYAYRRYRDPAYLLVLNQVGRHFAATYQQFPVSILYDRDRSEQVKPVEWKSVNFFGVGFGILRQTTDAGTTSLLMDYGPHGSHGHPDKLNIDLYAFDDRLIPDPGSAWYEQAIYRDWYATTFSHNTLVVDMKNQRGAAATQVIYSPGDRIAVQRAWTDAAYPGVIMDRSLFLTPGYVADIFGAFTRLPRVLDLAWHIRGEFSSELPLTEWALPEPIQPGYSELIEVRRAETDQAWSADLTRNNTTARFIAAGGTPTEVIVGAGVMGMEKPPTIVQRRVASETVYGNVVDISGGSEAYVTGVEQSGSLTDGFGLLTVHTRVGSDLCFATFTPGSYSAGDLRSDAQQAFVSRQGDAIVALSLGGGTTLQVAGVVLTREPAGLASLEQTSTGAYVLANPSPAEAVVSITLPALAGMQAFVLDHEGKRTGPATIEEAAGVRRVRLAATGRVEFSPAGVASAFDVRQAMLAKRQAEQEAEVARERNECAARTAVRAAEATANPVPAGVISVVNGAAMSDQAGGKVFVSATKRGAVGDSFGGWNGIGHWLEYTVTVPAEGYYHLTICYCTQDDLAERQIMVNGVEQEPFAPMVLATTGGYSNGSDDWRLFTAQNPVSGKPLLLKLTTGENILRLTNLNGRATNLNYVAVHSPDVQPTRDLVGGRLAEQLAAEPAPAP